MEVVTSMQSVEGEVVNFPKTVRPRGVVEQWLTAVEQAMYDAVKHHLKVRSEILPLSFSRLCPYS